MRRLLLAGIAGLLLPATLWGQRGTLRIVGGGSQPPELVRHFVDLAGGPGKARIAVLPMASSEPLETGVEKADQRKELGADAFVLNLTRDLGVPVNQTLYRIPQAEMDAIPNLVRNPGY